MNILIIGGYGAVGREAAAALARRHTVTVAGRAPDKAAPVPGTTALRLDVGDEAALEAALTGVDAVLMCVDLDNPRVARTCLERGVHYVDVTADHSLITGIETLDSPGATALVSVGLVPGVTNLLAKACVERSGADAIETAVLLGAGEHHGAAAVSWTLDAVAETGPSWSARFPAPYNKRTVYGFPFSDQHTLPLTLGISRARTGMCLDSRVMTALLPRTKPLLRHPRARAVIEKILMRVHVGGDGFALSVSAGGATASFTGRRQSRGTGLAAAVAVERLPGLPPGVHHIEQVMDPAEYLKELATEGFDLRLPSDHYDAG